MRLDASSRNADWINVARDQARRLQERGISKLAELAVADDGDRPPTMQPRTFDALRDQAALQLEHRRTDEHVTRILLPDPARGFALLPAPSRGDLFFDIEGDPFWAPNRSRRPRQARESETDFHTPLALRLRAGVTALLLHTTRCERPVFVAGLSCSGGVFVLPRRERRQSQHRIDEANAR